MLKHKPLFVLIVMLLLLSLACGKFSLGKPTATPEPTATEIVLPTDTPVPAPTMVPTATVAEAVAEVVPTEEPVVTETDGVAVDQIFFLQEETTLVYAFYVNNPDPVTAYVDSEYDVVVYDDAGNILQTSYGYVSLLRQSERLGVVNNVYMDEGQTAAKVDIGFKAGNTTTDATSSPFVVDKINYLADEYFPLISCTIENTSSQDITDVYVSAIAFDEAGNFVGGGYTYQYFLLSQSISGVTVSPTGSATPARVEVYPMLSSFSEFQDVPQDSFPLTVQEMGGATADTRVDITFFVSNTVEGMSVESSMYQVVVYDANDNVLGVSMGYIGVVLPGAHDPVNVDVYLTENVTPDNYTIQVLSGDLVEPQYPSNPFSTKDAVYVADDWYPVVTGTLVNSLGEAVDGLMVVAVAYNANGDIIGGGYTYADGLPANGTLPVEVSVTVSDTPVSVELYPIFTSLTEIGGE